MWQIMYSFNRYSHHVLNFIAIDLELYKIFKITWVSFLAHIVDVLKESKLRQAAAL